MKFIYNARPQKTFDFHGNFFSIPLCSEDAFCTQINWYDDLFFASSLSRKVEWIMRNTPSVRYQRCFDTIMKPVFCHNFKWVRCSFYSKNFNTQK